MDRIHLAGLAIEYDMEFPPAYENALADYRTGASIEEETLLKVNPSLWTDEITDETGQDRDGVNFFALSVALGEQLPLHRRIQTHGVAIAFEGRSYIFSAASGTGKSTRAFLWQKYLGKDKVRVINGDKPILWFKGDAVLACGSPWAGKEGLSENVCVPLGGICLLRRSPENKIRRARAQEFFDSYSAQVQMPKDPQGMLEALSLMEELYAKIPVFILENDMSERGVEVCFEAITGEKYSKYRI